MSSSIKQEKLVINTKKASLIKQQNSIKEGQYQSFPAIQRELDQSRTYQGDLNDRLKRLQGNLKLLEKKYRENLKEGFENKIKAYRLEAVFQRKVLKEAMKHMQKQKEQSQVRKKWSTSEKKSQFFNSRIQIIKMQRYQRNQQMRQQKKRDRASYSICLHENQNEMKTLAKLSHDRILDQEENINKKRDYFAFLRRSSYKRQQQTEKQELLERIYHNTQKLKQAKQTLEVLKYTQDTQDRSKTFLTI